MKVTTGVKRRQSDVQAATQVKRLSLVTHPEADRVENLEGNSKRPQRRRLLETLAGSKSTAWTEMEASWHLGDPLPSRPGKQAEYVNRMDQPEGDRSDGGSRTR
jgi:hypothetical protein